jgi:hypothetical protein
LIKLKIAKHLLTQIWRCRWRCFNANANQRALPVYNTKLFSMISFFLRRIICRQVISKEARASFIIFIRCFIKNYIANENAEQNRAQITPLRVFLLVSIKTISDK